MMATPFRMAAAACSSGESQSSEYGDKLTCGNVGRTTAAGAAGKDIENE